MSENTVTAPVARSPIRPAEPVVVTAGWEVSGCRAHAEHTLTDLAPLTKVQVRAAWDGAMAQALAVPFGRAARREDGALVVGAGPGEWLALAPPGTADALTARIEALAAERAPDELVSVVDLTHGRALVRLTGPRTVELLAQVCALDFDDRVVPDGAALRTAVARVATDIVRDDLRGRRSYLLHCERSSGQYLFDALHEAGEQFGIEIDGFTAPGI